MIVNLLVALLATAWASSIHLQRRVDGSGFHLKLEYELRGAASCHVGVVERFPKEAYLDADQVAQLARVGSLNGTIVDILTKPVNVESAAASSVPCDFTVKMGIGRCVVPFHLRYQEPQVKRYGTVTIGEPLLICSDCATSGHASSDRGHCKAYFGDAFGPVRLSDGLVPIQMGVPVGDPLQSDLVMAITSTIVALASVYLAMRFLCVQDIF